MRQTTDADYGPAVVVVAACLLSSSMVSAQFFGPPLFIPAGDSPEWVDIGDLDGDGLEDVVVVNFDSTDLGTEDLTVMLSNGDGTFTVDATYDIGKFNREVLLGDLDGDLDLDIAANASGDFGGPGGVFVLLNAGDGSFGSPTPYNLAQPQTIFNMALGDIDGDTDLDIIAKKGGSQAGYNMLILINAGDGTFSGGQTFFAGSDSEGTSLGDLDGDSDLDLVVVSPDSFDEVNVLFNDGNGLFGPDTDYPVGDDPRDAAIGDLDGDLDLDIVAINSSSADLSVLLNMGNGMFAPEVRYPGGSAELIELNDFDLDGDLDVAAMNQSSEIVRLFINDGGGSFSAATPLGPVDDPRSMAMGDIDGDGDDDLVTGDYFADEIALWLNNAIFVPEDAVWSGGGGLAFSDPNNWQGGAVATTSNVALFDSSVAPYGPIEFAAFLSATSIGAMRQANEELRLDMFGSTLTIVGLPPGDERIGLELGVAQQQGVSLPAVPPVLRLNNADVQPAGVVTKVTIVGKDGPATVEIDASNGITHLDASNELIVGDGGDGTVEILTAASELRYGEFGSPGGTVVIGAGATGLVDVTAGSLEALDSLDSMVLGRDPGSEGTIRISGPSANWSHLTSDMIVGDAGSGMIEITAGGTVTSVVSNGTVIARQTGSTGAVLISGAGSSWTDIGGVTTVGGEGVATVTVEDGGQLSLVGLINTASGTVNGDGTIIGSIVNFGELVVGLDPDISAATLVIDGDYDQFDDPADPQFSGRLLVDLFESGGAVSSDLLSISGEAALAGALRARGIDPFDPAVGDRFEVLTAGQITNRFDVAFFPGFADGRFLRLEYGIAALNGSPVSHVRGPVTDNVTVVVDTLGEDVQIDSGLDFTAGGRPTAADIGDLDGDGDLDLVVTIPDAALPDAMPGSIVILFNGGTTSGTWNGFSSTVQVSVGVNPTGVSVGSFDDVNGIDIAVANNGDNTAHVLLNQGGGAFSSAAPADIFAAGVSPVDIAAVDLDADGFDDIAVTTHDLGGNGVLSVRLNAGVSNGWDGLGGEQGFALLTDPTDVDPGDFDNDKDLDTDLAIANPLNNAVSVLINLGVSTSVWQGFDPRLDVLVGNSPEAIDIIDLDLDGFNDIASANSGDGSVSIVLSQGDTNNDTTWDGGFRPSVELPVGQDARSIAAADLDSDGDADLVIVADDELGEPTIRVLRNDLAGGQLAFASAQDVQTGAAPLLVLTGDIDGNNTSDIISINQDTGGTQAHSGEQTAPAREHTKRPQFATHAGLPFSGPTMSSDVSVALNLLAMAPACPGDATGDNIVDINDLNAVIGNFGNNGAAGIPGDINDDGSVDINDLNQVLGNFGGAC